MTGHYNNWLVLVSLVVASLASYTALDLASRIRASTGAAARAWLIGGAFSMGMGIWAMHFIGMLAFSLPVPLGYDFSTTLLSMTIAVVVSSFALYIATRDTLTWTRLAIAGAAMGMGICSMHYVGMYAIRMDPAIRYDLPLVAASVAVAIAASVAALWMAFKSGASSAWSRYAMPASALVMGLAITGMHYTAMAAARFAPNAVCLSGTVMDTFWMAGAITLITLFILSVTLMLSLMDARMSMRTATMGASLAHAHEINKAKDEFLAMLGHELRNPLAAISNAVLLLERTKADSESSSFARDVIRRQSTHLKRMIDDLLDASRVARGKITLEQRPTDLNACVERALGSLTTAGRAARHRIGHSGIEVWVRGDATRLEQVVTNLVLNAITYTPEGGAINVSVSREGGDAVLAVSDTGIGIGADAIAHVFDLFYQAQQDLSRSSGGLGIGLTLVRSLVELHGGGVVVSSAGPGKGASFAVRLPAIDKPPDSRRNLTGSEPTRARRIVLIEDEADSRRTLQRVLEQEGHSVTTAEDGARGIELIRESRPDVAIVDIGLPGMSGYEVARQVKAEHGGKVLLIALTGYGQQDDEHRAKGAGFDAHVTKPADLAELARLITAERRRADYRAPPMPGRSE